MKKVLNEWCRDHIPDDKMLWKEGYFDQVNFISRQIPNILAKSYEEFKKMTEEEIFVISTHMSKSIILPVYNFVWNGWEFMLRENFYDWKISVIAPEKYKDIEIDFMNIFNQEQDYSIHYFEGFNSEWVYESYKKNKQKFSFEITNNYKLFTFFWILKNYVMKEE